LVENVKSTVSTYLMVNILV